MRLHLLRHDHTRDETETEAAPRPAAVWGVDSTPASIAVIHAATAAEAQLAQTA